MNHFGFLVLLQMLHLGVVKHPSSLRGWDQPGSLSILRCSSTSMLSPSPALSPLPLEET